MQVSERWQTTDKHLYFMANFSDVRALIEVKSDADGWVNATHLNDTIPASVGSYETGMNVVYNNTNYTDPMAIHFVVSGKGAEYLKDREFKFIGHRCDGPCAGAITAVPISTTANMWSDPNTWNSGVVPVADEEVHIEPGWNVVLDIDTPILARLIINGRLSFKNDTDLHLHVKHIYIRAGELVIGYKDAPF